MTRQIRRKLENAFYNYEQNYKNASDNTAAIDKGLIALYGGVKVDSGFRNAREAEIIKSIDKELELWRWCYLVERTIDYFYIGGRDEFIRARYFKRLGETETCRLCHICRATYYNWLDDVLMVAEKWAKEYKLIGE